MIRTFPKCLKTNLGNGDNRVLILIPYDGNLTESKFDELGAKLHQYCLNHRNRPGVSVQPYSDFLSREWYTTREKNVAVVQNEHRGWDISGKNWGLNNFPKERVIILE